MCNFYFVNIDETKSYQVNFIFKSEKNKQMDKLSIVNCDKESEYIDSTDIEIVDDEIIVKYTFSNINSDFDTFCIKKWYYEETEYKFNTKGSNTYIKGVCFRFEQVDEICLNL